jgi:hypothetical protein
MTRREFEERLLFGKALVLGTHFFPGTVPEALAVTEAEFRNGSI